MSSEREKIKRINNFRDSRLSTVSAALGLDARRFDIKKLRETVARSLFSFPVKVQRSIELALVSKGEPEIQDLIDKKSSTWYLGKKGADCYADLVWGYIDQVEDWKLIRTKEGRVIGLWKDPIEPYDKCGDYLKITYARGLPSRKLVQVDSILLLDEVMSGLPIKDELEPDVLGMSRSRTFEMLSILESIGTIQITPSGNLFPSIALELVGDHINTAIDDGISHPVGRTMYQILVKMPGVSLSKLIHFFPLDLSKNERRIRFVIALEQLVKNDLIFAIPDPNRGLFLIPSWVCRHILRNYSSTYLDSHILRIAIGIAASFWEIVPSLSEVDVALQKLKTDLRWLMGKKRVSMDELVEIGPPSTQTINTLRKAGVVKFVIPDQFEIVKERSSIISVLIDILENAYRTEVDYPSAEIDESMINEIKATLPEIKQIVAEKLRVKDLKKIRGLD